MDADKVVQDLNRRFATPLPEFYKRRIIVWHDEDREFEDKISDISPNRCQSMGSDRNKLFCDKEVAGGG